MASFNGNGGFGGGFNTPAAPSTPTTGVNPFGAGGAAAPTVGGFGGGFGGAAAPAVGGFGAPAPAFGGFGGAPAPAPAVGGFGGGFGGAAAPAVGGFGAPAPATGGFGFAPAPAVGGFGGGFGGAAAPAVGGFGAPAPATGGFGFGGAAAPAPAVGGFGGGFGGAAAPAVGGFGGGFGVAPAASVGGFGQQQQYGQATAAAVQSSQQCWDTDKSTDSITSIAMDGSNDRTQGGPKPTTLLAVSSWDLTTNIFQINEQTGAGQKLSTLQHSVPVMSSDCLPGTDMFLFGDATGNVTYWSKSSNSPAVQVFCAASPQSHTSAIRILKATSPTEFFTAGWDGKVLQWDTTKGFQPQNGVALVLPQNQPNRVYAMDANADFVVIGTADKWVTVYARNAPHGFGMQCKPVAQYELPKYQIRCISLFARNSDKYGQTGFCIGTIDGRVHIEYMNEVTYRNGRTQQDNFDNKQQGMNSFNFKCHRESIENAKQGTKTTKIFTVNAIHFNQQHNTFLTAGSDGLLEIWDADNKTKVVPLVGHVARSQTSEGSRKAPVILADKYEYKCPISTAKFSPNSKLLFAAFSYDWSRGDQEFTAYKDNYPNYVSVFQTVTPHGDDVLIRPKPSQKNVGGGQRR